MRLLCIEPSRSYQRLLGAACKESGIEASFVEAGRTGLERLSSDTGIDFITVSFYLKDMTAIDLIHAIRSLEAYRFTPVVLITSESSEDILHRALGAGVTDIFQKSELDSLVLFLTRFNRQRESMHGRVLCVEDSPVQQNILRAQLESIGLTVDCCATVEAAWEKFTATSYDLVITDIVFEKDLGGIRMVNNIRRHISKQGDVPILAMSAFDDPVRRIEILNRGANDYITKPILEEELIARVKGLIRGKQYLDQLHQDYKQRSREAHNLQIDLLNYQNHDQLTSLCNRTALLDRLNRDLSRSSRLGYVGALLYIDLDNFKDINDALGHQVGDELLKQVADRLRNFQRPQDTVARLEGDDFVMLVTEVGKDIDRAADAVARMADQVQQLLAEPFDVEGQTIHSLASVGIALYPNQGSTLYDILKQADAARYQAKSKGKNAIAFFSEKVQTELEERVRLAGMLRSALSQDEFHLNVQPIYYRGTTIVGCEVLLRWQRPDGEFISPATFIPVAENSGLMESLGRWVMRESFALLRHWMDQGLPECFQFFAINCSARQFREESFVADVANLIQEFAVDPSLLELEITESLLMEDLEAAVHKMEALKALGVRFAIDDFGTGFSSLCYLKQLPIHKLKIDRSFVSDITDNRNDMAIVETIIAMAKSMALDVVAEGIETEAQQVLLIEKQCDKMQGFLFSRPLLPEDCLQRILHNAQLSQAKHQ